MKEKRKLSTDPSRIHKESIFVKYSQTLPLLSLPILSGLIHVVVASEIDLSSIALVHDSTSISSSEEKWSIHFQSTAIPQSHGSFSSPYSGANSLSSNSEFQTSFTSTLFLGARLWKGAEGYINPELLGGSGLSSTHGVAGFTNGEIYRVDSSDLKPNLSRFFIQQDFGLGREEETVGADKNQLAGKRTNSRITVVAGKFSLNDYFDNNAYSHDPRTQFMNWALMDNGAWDYAADTRGYSWGFMLEFNQPSWAVRFASVLEPLVANMMEFDTNISQAHGDNLEFEYRYQIRKRPGKARLLGFMNHAHMGNYRDALSVSPNSPNITQTRDYRTKYGFGVNLEQELTSDLGGFVRAGWNDGHTETWTFTEIDRSLSVGGSLKGTSWKRPEDVLGLAMILNGLSSDHADYLKAGGFGFIIGDGGLNYAPEEIVETYYSFQVLKQLAMAVDYQWVNSPAYNQDRGSVSVFAGRLHYEF